jgi:mRNA-degrading endonuclease RelE of RelBE toxin-antitoxin system
MRVGDFRIGFFVESNNEIMVSTFLHRKDIYKKFP